MNAYNGYSLILAAGLALAALPAHRVLAIGGVGDVVIIAADNTDMWKWPREKAEWSQVQALLKTQIEQNKVVIERLGNPKLPASATIGNVARVTDPAAMAAALQSRTEAMESGKSSLGPGKGGAALRADMKVEASFEVLGTRYTRELARFSYLAQQEALLNRQEQAFDNQSKVVDAEMETQRRLLERLKSATTQSDIEAAAAALTASQQRLEIARQKADQARDEYSALEARLRLEGDRKREADQEWAAKFIEKLRARAVTSLHAQQGDNG